MSAMEYEKCYVYQADDSRPAKRRKTEPQGLHASWNIRRANYRKAWAAQEANINDALNGLNGEAVDKLTYFLDDVTQRQESGGIPTAILSTGPEASSSTTVIARLSREQNAHKKKVFVSIAADTASNVKGLLKAIIQKATSRQDGVDDEDEEATSPKKGAKLLNYDLQLLADYVSERQLDQVAIAICDTEAFDSDLLSDLIELLGFWQDRIPVVFLLSVATSVSSLQQRLSRAAVRCLKGELFDVAPATTQLETALEAIVTGSPSIWPGTDLITLILERQSDYIQSIDSFGNAVKYAYMSHYYANALTVFLVPDIKQVDIPQDHFEAVRNLDSFQQHCRRLLDGKQGFVVRSLLESDTALFTLAIDSIRNARIRLAEMTPALKFLKFIQETLHNQPSPSTASFGKLYRLAMAGKLTSDSSLIRSTLLSVRKSQSHIIAKILSLIDSEVTPETYRSRAAAIQEELVQLLADAANDDQPLRSEADIHNSTLRTTIVAKKVELSKQRATLSKRDEAYTKLLRRFSDLLEEYFTATLVDPKTLPFHELVVYDLRSPYRETFTPRPRQAIERALASPHDYLDCDCCAPDADGREDEATLAASQPATAVLYQLYRESGNLINISDLRQAFLAVVDEDGKDENENMALFQRALAELKCLGFLKATRKRVDHAAKVAWKGL